MTSNRNNDTRMAGAFKQVRGAGLLALALMVALALASTAQAQAPVDLGTVSPRPHS